MTFAFEMTGKRIFCFIVKVWITFTSIYLYHNLCRIHFLFSENKNIRKSILKPVVYNYPECYGLFCNEGSPRPSPPTGSPIAAPNNRRGKRKFFNAVFFMTRLLLCENESGNKLMKLLFSCSDKFSSVSITRSCF